MESGKIKELSVQSLGFCFTISVRFFIFHFYFILFILFYFILFYFILLFGV
jgi:hypothetical protein